MSQLQVYSEESPGQCETYTDFDEICKVLEPAGVIFERWSTQTTLNESMGSEDILEAYKESVDHLMKDRGFQSVDVISLDPSYEGHEQLRKKFLDEHIHTEDEARFFINGSGLFYIHLNTQVFGLTCEKGDLINVPAGTRHWFDMGPKPSFQCIRLFTSESGWVAQYTGDNIADKFPRYNPE